MFQSESAASVCAHCECFMQVKCGVAFPTFWLLYLEGTSHFPISNSVTERNVVLSYLTVCLSVGYFSHISSEVPSGSTSFSSTAVL